MRLHKLLPQSCCLCGLNTSHGYFCIGCENDLLYSKAQTHQRCHRCALLMTSEHCPDCYQWPPAFDKAIAAFDYVPPLDYLMAQYKQNKRLILAQAFASLFVKRLNAEQLSIAPNSLFVPIPGSVNALHKRGFNPATEFAKALAKQLACKVDVDILMRHQEKTDGDIKQKQLNQAQRRAHASRLYFCNQLFQHSKVYLVDDVLTTGSTLDAASRALKAAGVQQVEALVIARTPISMFEAKS